MSTTEQTHQQDLERLKLFRYMDDDFMTACLEDNYEAVELILRIVLGQEDITIKSIRVQDSHEKFARAFCYFRCSCS
ncbi:MAG: hypothetical protein ACLTJ5_00045 [Clostridium sp.]